MANASLLRSAVKRVDLAMVSLVMLVALFMGGSSLSGIEGHGWIQLVSIPLLLWVVLRARPVPMGGTSWAGLSLILALGVFGLVQALLVPGIDWPEDTPRGLIETAQPILGLGARGIGFSLSPGESLSAALAILPALAVFIAVATARWTYTIEGLHWGVVIVAAASAGLGVGQLVSGETSPLFLYGTGQSAPGFFSNSDHQASFLVMVMPLALALVLEKRKEIGVADGEVSHLVAAVGLSLLLVAGLVATRSTMGYALLAAVLPLCLIMAFPSKSQGTVWTVLPVLLGAVLVGGAAIVHVGLNEGLLMAESGAPASRPEVWQKSLSIARDHLPFGTGLGSFEYVYPLYENQDGITARYMNSAHNEYLQAIVELGAMGALLISLGLVVWAVVTVSAWQGKANDEGRIRRAASLSIFVIVLHSLVDYPLHAPAYMVMAAAIAGILCLPPRHVRQASQKRPAQAEDKRISL